MVRSWQTTNDIMRSILADGAETHRTQIAAELLSLTGDSGMWILVLFSIAVQIKQKRAEYSTYTFERRSD